MKKIVLIFALVIFIALVGMGVYYYFEVYRTPEAKQSREVQETNEAYVFLRRSNLEKAKTHKYTVLLNPAHGGEDIGVIHTGDEDIYSESQINLAICQYVVNMIDNEEVAVILTRETDTNPTLEQRVEMVKETVPDLVVDVRLSQSENISDAGTTAYYSSQYYDYRFTNEEFANLLEKNVVSTQQGIAKGLINVDEIVNKDDYSFIRELTVPAAAIECGYLTGGLEAPYLVNESYQQTIAKGIVLAIEEALDYGK